ncbi:MAG TPA: TetR family transcriptional regulator, partial [Myxococcota bacterium]|nr:TetR family transcriptional regulator [Myxococcota bacterium]
MARDLFAEKGFADTALDDVAGRARVTKGAVYHHFSDKHRLFAEVFTELERELDAAARAAAMAAASEPRTAFLAGCRAFLEFARRPDYLRIGLTDAPSVLGGEGRAIDNQLGMPTVEGAVKALIAVGRIEPRPSKPLALLLLGALNEAGFALGRGEPGFDIELALDAIGRLLDGLAPREPERTAPRAGKQRLDERLVRDGLAESRTKAQALIRLGRVTVEGAAVEKPGAPVRDSAAVAVRAAERFVSRGGEKLAGALADLGVEPAGRVCLDVGASTGGFTDCLLQAGARPPGADSP